MDETTSLSEARRRNLMHRATAGLLAAAFVAVVSCGGGGSDEGSSDTGTPPPSTIPQPVNGPSLSLQTLHDAATDVAGHLSALQTTGSGSGDAQAIAAYIRTKPEFADAGANDDNSVWARYTDGTPFIVYSNQRADGSVAADAGATLAPIQPTGLASAWERAGRRAGAFVAGLAQRGVLALVPPAAAATALAAGAPATVVLPKGKTALSLSVIGFGGSASSVFASAMNTAGYSATIKSGTVADFRAVSNVAVLHVSSHGAPVVQKDNTTAYSIGTSDVLECSDNPSCDALNRNMQDRGDGLLAIAVYVGHPKDAYWAITTGFISHYWTLAQDAVVFLDACSSGLGSPTNKAMRDAIANLHAATIVGWSAVVYSGSAQDIFSYMFDRILGANTYQPESPPQRPFSVREVFNAMDSTGRSVDHGPGSIARLALFEYGPDASILVPSIRNMVVQEDEKRLILYGEFGGVAGKAKIDTNEIAPQWGSDAMALDLPQDANGPVVVIGPDGQLSNPVPLTDFTGTMTLTRKLDATLGPGFTDVADCTKLRFRADVHSYRDAPGRTPIDGSMAIENFSRDISCTWKMTGTSTDGLKTVNDSGTLFWSDNTLPTPPPPFIFGKGSVKGGASPTLKLQLSCRANADLKVTDPFTGLVTDTVGPMICLLGLESSGALNLNADYSYPQQTLTIPTQIPPDSATLKIHFNAVSPPDSKTPS